MNDVNCVLRELVDVFESMQLPYAVMGGIAVRAHGIPRPTYDVDFTVAIPRDQLGQLYQQLGDRGDSIADSYRSGWMDRIAGMPLVKCRLMEGRGVDVDLFLAESPFQQELLRRRVKTDVDGHPVNLVTPEDLVLLKLVANRPRDWADILDVMFTQGSLDESYLREWAVHLGVSDKLAMVLDEYRADSAS